MIFLQGTIIMHSAASGQTREQIIQQVIEQEDSVRDFNNYIPIGKAPLKINNWVRSGAEICYLSALTKDKKVRGDEIVGKRGLKADNNVLSRYNFPASKIYHRESGETYKDIVERVRPDILIEDDCASIGGEKEMAYPYIAKDIQKKIKWIKVKEFGGIDFLPDSLQELNLWTVSQWN